MGEIDAITDKVRVTAPVYRVLYDGQCEICQACVAWLKTIDREDKTLPLPISSKSYPQWMLGLDWTNACGSCMSSRPRAKSSLAGTPLRL